MMLTYQGLHHVRSLEAQALDDLEHVQDSLGLHLFQRCREGAESSGSSGAGTVVKVEVITN